MNGADLMRSAQKSPKTVQDYAAATAEEMAYRQSEEYQRKQWEADQKRWLDLHPKAICRGFGTPATGRRSP